MQDIDDNDQSVDLNDSDEFSSLSSDLDSLDHNDKNPQLQNQLEQPAVDKYDLMPNIVDPKPTHVHDKHDDESQSISISTSNSLPQVVEDNSDPVLSNRSKSISNDSSNGISNEILNAISRDLPNDMSNDITNKISNDTSITITESNSNHINVDDNDTTDDSLMIDDENSAQDAKWINAASLDQSVCVVLKMHNGISMHMCI